MVFPHWKCADDALCFMYGKKCACACIWEGVASTLHRVRGEEDRTSLVLRKFALLAVHKRHRFALLRVRGHKLVLAEFTKRGRCDIPGSLITTPMDDS